MTKMVSFVRDQKNQFRAEIDVISDWDGFDKLIRYLEVNYHAKILEAYDGPDARRWIVDVNGKKIEVIHNDDYGNYFLAPTQEEEEIVQVIGKDLKVRLKDM